MVIFPVAAAKVMITPGAPLITRRRSKAGAVIMPAYILVLAGTGAARMVRHDVG
jgi:hypothetical protein